MRLRRVILLFINYDGNKAFRTNNILKTYCERECTRNNTAVNRMIGLDGNHNYMGQTAGYWG